jgi:integrase/recombinase XerC
VSGAAEPASSQLWVDQGVTPAQAVPTTPELAAQYLANALMHPVYEHWNWQRLIKVYGALPDARRAKPRVCKLLLNVASVVEYWQKGKLHVVAGPDAPDPAAIVLQCSSRTKRDFDW